MPSVAEPIDLLHRRAAREPMALIELAHRDPAAARAVLHRLMHSTKYSAEIALVHWVGLLDATLSFAPFPACRPFVAEALRNLAVAEAVRGRDLRLTDVLGPGRRLI